MQQYDAHLSSFISIVNNRTTNLLKGIQLNTKVINNIAAAVDAKFVQMEHSMTNVSSLLIQQINEANVLRSNLDNLQSAIQNLIEGKLSPFLIPKQKLKSVIQDISKMLRTSHKGFYLTHTNPTYYYSHGKFLYARNNRHVYLSIKFPFPLTRPQCNFTKLPPFLFLLIFPHHMLPNFLTCQNTLQLPSTMTTTSTLNLMFYLTVCMQVPLSFVIITYH